MNSNKPYIVAEISANHHGSFDRALAIIDAAKEAGADAVKIQTFKPEEMVADETYTIKSGPWAGQKLIDLYRQAYTPWEWHKDIFDYCKNVGIDCFSSPFHKSAVDFLEKLDCQMYKVASFEIVDIPLIRYIAVTGKPIVFSTGMATLSEIAQAYITAEDGFADVEAYLGGITLLKCTSAYPSKISDADLLAMNSLRDEFGCEVGISDHTPGFIVAASAVAMGATMVEKHLTLDDQPGPDSNFSMRPDDFKFMVAMCRAAYEARGQASFGTSQREASSLKLRRSLYVVQDVKAGDQVTEENVQTRRPALGVEPRKFDQIVGKRFTMDVAAGTPMSMDLVA